VLFVSVLKLFDPSLEIRGPVLVKQAEFIHDRKVPTNYTEAVQLANTTFYAVVAESYGGWS